MCIRDRLLDYDRSERYPDAKEWYDGYHFGNADIYCPWDVINYICITEMISIIPFLCIDVYKRQRLCGMRTGVIF